MKQSFIICVLIISMGNSVFANGLLIPTEPELPALAMLNHHVNVTLEDQVAITHVQQTFRNHTDRQLEATYVFPIPQGATISDFAMWVDKKKVKGEMVSAGDARSMYTSIVRQTRNPALLDHIGSDLLSLKIFPIQPGADQKISIRFTSLAQKEHQLVEYVYPLKSDRDAISTLEEFRLKVDIKSRRPIGNIYSPTHEITVNQSVDHRATIEFEESAANLDRDFQIFYTEMGKDIGLTALDYRPVSDEDGYMMFLVSPRAELSKDQKVPRDIVFVMDTSGSMRNDDKMDQAKSALKQCLDGLASDDRFALVSFGSTVNRYRDQLVPANQDHIENGKGWVANQYASGGTAIHSALMSALKLRGTEPGRMFTIAFFTDGQPTIGETNIEKILNDVRRRNTANTRIFSFGLGDDLNAVFLDRIADQTRAISSYVRPHQKIDDRVASFFKKIHHPVLANLELSTTGNVQLAEVYPPQLPDLFHGDQLVVLARFAGHGKEQVVLKGQVGQHPMKFSYDVNFNIRNTKKPFVEELWARRKVGYLLDQIRINGEQRELVDEVVLLAKRYGITTPYTSYLIMPDAPLDVASRLPAGGERLSRFSSPSALAPNQSGQSQKKLVDFAREVQRTEGELARNRNAFQDQAFENLDSSLQAEQQRGIGGGGVASGRQRMQSLNKARRLKSTLDKAKDNYASGNWMGNHFKQLGVDLSTCTNRLKCQRKLEATAIRNVNSRNCMEYGGVWIDEKFTAATKTVAVRAQSPAYFKILQRHPQMKDVFQLGNHIVWIAPNGIALVVDTTDGKETMSDKEIDNLFASK